MGAPLTADVFGTRKTDLVRAIELAEGEYFSAAFKAQTGAGTAEDTNAAKSHLDQLRADLEALEAAWLMAQAQADTARSDARQASFEACLAECDDLLATRRTAVLAAQEAAGKVAEAIADFEQASRTLRAKLAPFHGNTGGGASLSNALTSLDLALDPSTWTASMAAGAAIGDAGVHLFTSMRTADVFGDVTATEFEDKNALRIRTALARFAPHTVEA